MYNNVHIYNDYTYRQHMPFTPSKMLFSLVIIWHRNILHAYKFQIRYIDSKIQPIFSLKMFSMLSNSIIIINVFLVRENVKTAYVTDMHSQVEELAIIAKLWDITTHASGRGINGQGTMKDRLIPLSGCAYCQKLPCLTA